MTSELMRLCHNVRAVAATARKSADALCCQVRPFTEFRDYLHMVGGGGRAVDEIVQLITLSTQQIKELATTLAQLAEVLNRYADAHDGGGTGNAVIPDGGVLGNAPERHQSAHGTGDVSGPAGNDDHRRAHEPDDNVAGWDTDESVQEHDWDLGEDGETPPDASPVSPDAPSALQSTKKTQGENLAKLAASLEQALKKWGPKHIVTLGIQGHIFEAEVVEKWNLEGGQEGDSAAKDPFRRIYTQVHVEGVKRNQPTTRRLDIYDIRNKGAERIVSVKYSQFTQIQPKSAKAMIREPLKKYAPKTPIAGVNTRPGGEPYSGLGSRPKELTKLVGRLFLCVPSQEEPIPQKLLDYAAKRGVDILQEDVTDIWLEESGEGPTSGRKDT